MDHLFDIAKEKITGEQNKQVLDGLRQMVAQLEDKLYIAKPRYQDAFFFSDPNNMSKLQDYIALAKNSIDLCVSSFSRTELAGVILAAHARGIKVRIITDAATAKNKGADFLRMANAGISCRSASEQLHIRSKFMIIDSMFLVTGSFDWTS